MSVWPFLAGLAFACRLASHGRDGTREAHLQWKDLDDSTCQIWLKKCFHYHALLNYHSQSRYLVDDLYITYIVKRKKPNRWGWPI